MRKQALREEWKESGCRLKGRGGGGYLSLQLCQQISFTVLHSIDRGEGGCVHQWKKKRSSLIKGKREIDDIK